MVIARTGSVQSKRTTLRKSQILCPSGRIRVRCEWEDTTLPLNRSAKKRSRFALLIPLALIALDGGLRLWRADSIPGGLLSAAGAVVWFVLEIRGFGVRSWIDEEVKPRKGEGKGGLL